MSNSSGNPYASYAQLMRSRQDRRDEEWRRRVQELERLNRQWAEENMILAAGWEAEERKVQEKEEECEELRRQVASLKEQLENSLKQLKQRDTNLENLEGKKK